jgi:hypothetical protein
MPAKTFIFSYEKLLFPKEFSMTFGPWKESINKPTLLKYNLETSIPV